MLLRLKSETNIAEETRLQAFEAGADAFLEKPFKEKELLLRVEKLIEQRNNLRSYFSGQISKLPTQVEKQESAFIQSLKTLVFDNIEKTIDVPFLCNKLAISRTQLHRKIKALTNLSTTELVRNIRLEEAEKLLRTTNLTVSEIAYNVGFTSPSYFSRLFSKYYGVSPKAYKDENS